MKQESLRPNRLYYCSDEGADEVKKTDLDRMIARFCLENGYKVGTGTRILLGQYVNTTTELLRYLKTTLETLDRIISAKDKKLIQFDELQSWVLKELSENKTGKTHVSTA